ncbi:MAG: hypothetical protein IKO36_12125 [Bacteroidaceae bacterium]|nr:hypothetical protein [Bacteroidaceae bacterium]
MKSKLINSFEDYIKEDSFQITFTMSFSLNDLIDFNLITFNDDLSQDDLNNIFDYFKKSYMSGDSMLNSCSVNLSSNNIIFNVSSTSISNEIAKKEFICLIRDIVYNISNNFYAVCDKNENKIKKFVTKFYE